MEKLSLTDILSSLRNFNFGVVFAFMQGRHTTFAVFFALSGTYLALHGKLTGEYVAMITALQAFVLTHSVKESVEVWKGTKGGQ